FKRIKQQVVGSDSPIPGNLEVRFRLAACSRKHDIHHAQSGTAREKPLDGRRHDFSLGLSGLVRFQKSPKTVEDDVHAIADFSKLFSALDRAHCVKALIKGNQLERASGESA